jgi:three-Cys-motif partner protein
MIQRDPERYTQGDDGLLVEKVGRWAANKLKIVTDYVYAAGGARRNFTRPGTAYIDVFCGPGRSLVRDTTKFIDGSPVAAFKRALQSPGRFTAIHVSDADEELLAAAEKRLNAVGAPVHGFAGPASVAMPKIVQSLDPYGLHLAFLDPHNLGTLSFDLFEQLAKLKRIDVIVHVSLSDLQRNADRYTHEAHDQFDKFAPGWRHKVSQHRHESERVPRRAHSILVRKDLGA